MVIGVCSNKVRPMVQTNWMGKRGQYWKRDPWHVKNDQKTLCGIDCSEWITIGETMPDKSLCEHCRRKLNPGGGNDQS